MLNFDSLEEGLGIVSSPYSVNDFSKKCVSCYILWNDEISFLFPLAWNYKQTGITCKKIPL